MASFVASAIAFLVACVPMCLGQTESQRYNQFQMIRAHNSYHVAPDPALIAFANSFFPPSNDSEASLVISGSQYTHPSLTDLLAKYNIRSLELDFFDDPEGGRYAYRAANLLIGQPYKADDPALLEPGFKVMHVDNIDFGSTCATLALCLTEIKAWSDANPSHDPVTIFFEMKGNGLYRLLTNNGETGALDQLNSLISLSAKPGEPKEIEDVIQPTDDSYKREIEQVVVALGGPDKLVKPDDVRGSFATLADAIAGPTSPWPTLQDMRGKFVLVQTGAGRTNLLSIYGETLEGSPIFTKWFYNTSTPNIPSDAIIVDVSTNVDLAQGLVEKGYIVEGNADSESVEARANDTSKFDTLLKAGCHIIITDFVVKPTLFPSSYSVQLPNGASLRCNPVTASADCKDVIPTTNQTAPGVGSASTPAPTTNTTVAPQSQSNSSAKPANHALMTMLAALCAVGAWLL